MSLTIASRAGVVGQPVSIERLETMDPLELRAAIAGSSMTPLVTIAVESSHGRRAVHLKLEGGTATGSVKDRTARALVDHHFSTGALRPGGTLVESTSGNLGVALAALGRTHGFTFVAVVDPKVTPENLDRMIRLGARIEWVDEPDGPGGFLRTRLRRVAELCKQLPSAVWANQYSNPSNPLAHEIQTGPEILTQLPHPPGAVFVAVSTGGTLAGVARCMRRHSPATRVVAVDALGSVVFGGEAAPRLLVGIGASRQPEFDLSGLVDQVRYVSDAEAFGACRGLESACGISVGGSSGAVLAAAARFLEEEPGPGEVLCLCPDSGLGYRSTIWNDTWLASNGIAPDALTAPRLGRR